MNEKQRLVVNTLLNGVSQFASMIASLVFLPLLIRAFGTVDYALFILATSVSAYVGLLDLGVGAALTKMVAEHKAREDDEAVSAAISGAVTLFTGAGMVGALIMVAAGFCAPLVAGITPQGIVLLRTMLWITALLQLWYWPMSTARHVLAGLQRYDILAGTALAATIASIGTTVYVLMTGGGPVLLVVLNTAVATLVALANVIAARYVMRGHSVRLSRATRATLTAIFAFSWAVFIIQLSDVVFYQQTDRLLLALLAGAGAVTLYEAGAKFNVLVTFVSGLTVSAVLPLASSMDAAGRHESLRALFVRGTKYVAALIAPITVVLAVFAKPIITAWLPPMFAGQWAVAQVLVLPHALLALGLMGDSIVMSRGRIGKRIPYIVAQMVVNVVVSVLLIPRIGVMGVAVGTAVAHLLDFPLHMRFLFVETGVRPGEFLREVVAPVYPLLLVALGVAWGLSLTPLAGSLAGIFVASCISLAAYWAAVYVLGLSPAEKADVAEAIAAARRRIGLGARA